jgi:hypothetical protein
LRVGTYFIGRVDAATAIIIIVFIFFTLATVARWKQFVLPVERPDFGMGKNKRLRTSLRVDGEREFTGDSSCSQQHGNYKPDKGFVRNQ